MNSFVSQDGLKIKVFGVGGAGSNAVGKMAGTNLKNVELYVANTDKQHLYGSPIDNQILLGSDGRGAGGIPENGARAAIESEALIRSKVDNADMVFITAGMGGGTGTGAAPVFARLAKEAGCMVISVVTKPFDFEGRRRSMNAEKGIKELSDFSDSMMVISNNKMLEVCTNISFRAALDEVDKILSRTIKSIINLVAAPGLVNVDYADIQSVMSGKNYAYVGFGFSDMPNNEQRAEDVAFKALSSPLLEKNISGAKNAIVHISGGKDICISDAETIVNCIKKAAGENVDVIFGITIDEENNGKFYVTLIATGF